MHFKCTRRPQKAAHFVAVVVVLSATLVVVAAAAAAALIAVAAVVDRFNQADKTLVRHSHKYYDVYLPRFHC